jgi:hypothetical protein
MPVMDDREIPQALEALTPEFLTDALRGEGHLSEGRVVGVEVEPLGEGEGFMGCVGRLNLRYEGASAAAPASLIAKLPSLLPANRLMAELMGAYWREIHFYREMTDDVPIRTPRHYYSALTPDPMRPRLDMIMRVVDRMPGWFVDPMMTNAKQVMASSEHRYLLLIEDLAPAQPGDQISGGTPETCKAVLAAVAKVHAGFWQSPILGQAFWLSKLSVTAQVRHRMYREARAVFLGRYGDRLGDLGLKLVEWHDRNGVKLQRRLHSKSPGTLIHGDLRLDNVFFDDPSATDPVILADWQIMGRGPGAYDIAYLLSGTLDVSTTEKDHDALLRHYHDELQKGGVSDYSYDQFQRDYWRGLMSMLQLHGTAGAVDVGEERGGELMELWLDRTLALLRYVQVDELLR